MFELNRILVPVDFSECSERALGVALSQAFRFDADVFLLHVADRPGSKTYEDNAATAGVAEALEADEAALIELYDRVSKQVADATGLPELAESKRHLRIGGGTPAPEIVSAAEDANVDMIIMGTHGRTSIKEFFVGSTAEQVVKNATCAVLAVKPEGYPYLRD